MVSCVSLRRTTAGLWLVLLPSFGSATLAYGRCIEAAPVTQIGERAACYKALTKADSDHDGIVDWQINPHYGYQVFPGDPDLDNDGLPNFLDFAPLQTNHQEPSRSNSLPEFLHDTNDRVRDLQLQLFRRFGVASHFPRTGIADSAKLQFLRILTTVMISLHNQNLAPTTIGLDNVFVIDHLKNPAAQAIYVEPIRSLVIDIQGLRSAASELRTTLSHELGHAVVFARWNVSRLKRLASKFGGWQIRGARSLYDPQLLRPINVHAAEHQNFPTTYSYSSVHEWFAENFGKMILNPDYKAKSPVEMSFRRALLFVPATWARLKPGQ